MCRKQVLRTAYSTSIVNFFWWPSIEVSNSTADRCQHSKQLHMHINLLTIFEILALSENKYAEHCHKHDKFYANATHNFGKYYIKNCSKIRDLTNAQMPKIASSAHNLSHSLYIQTVFASQCSLGIVLKRHTLWYSLLSVHQASIQCPNGVG